MSKLDFAWNG